MNQRIRELAEQAGGNPNYSAFKGHFLPPPPDYIDPATVDLTKFAELIVKEAGAYLMQPEFIGRSDLDWSMVLNEHFGVK